MQASATALEFERAARLRDRLAAVRRAIEKQQMVGDRSEDIDVIGIAEDELEAAVQVFYVRKGRVLGRKGFILDKVEELPPGRLIDRILEAMYGDEPILGVPKQVLVPWDAEGVATYEEWLTMVRGSRVQVRVPQRGDKVALLDTVTRNAKEEFTRHRLRRASDHNTRSRALTELQDHLGLPEAPLRIECYDMAHLQGTDYVGSMVVTRGRSAEQAGVPPVQDPATCRATTTTPRWPKWCGAASRRTSTSVTGRSASAATSPGKFAYPPQLLLVDGGKGQLSAAKRVIDELELTDEIPVAGLAKRFEEVYIAGRSEPVEIPRGSEALFMLQRVRDEAHRFANTFHGERRSKRMTTSSARRDSGPRRGAPEEADQAEMGGVNSVKRAGLDWRNSSR